MNRVDGMEALDAVEKGEYGCCELTGADVQPMDFCSQGERRNAR